MRRAGCSSCMARWTRMSILCSTQHNSSTSWSNMGNHINFRFLSSSTWSSDLEPPLTRVLAHSLVQVYPGERHSLRHPDSNEHYLTSLLSFLKKNLWDLITARWGSSTWTNKIATNLWVQCRVQPCEIYDRRKMQSSRSVSQREKWSICLHFNCWLAYNLLTNVQHYAVKPLQANKLL